MIFKRNRSRADYNNDQNDIRLSAALEILKNGYGLKKTIDSNSCIDAEDNPIPWYTYPAIEYIKQLDFSKSIVFEFGSGNSSIFWSRESQKVTSVENNSDWYKKVLKNKPKNLNLLFREEKKSYLNSILEFKNHFDVIVIDGSYRDACCKNALKKIKENGLIILDNSDRAGEMEDYKKAISTLKKANFIQVDFIGFGPINGYTWATSFFFSRKNNLKSKNHPIQPSKTIGNISEI